MITELRLSIPRTHGRSIHRQARRGLSMEHPQPRLNPTERTPGLLGRQLTTGNPLPTHGHLKRLIVPPYPNCLQL